MTPPPMNQENTSEDINVLTTDKHENSSEDINILTTDKHEDGDGDDSAPIVAMSFL